MRPDFHDKGLTVRALARAAQRTAWLAALLLFCLLPAQPSVAQTFEEGIEAYGAGRWQEAAAVWQVLADNGDARAQHAMGSLYETGRGVPQNYARAAEWYTKAADQGLANAQNDLAVLYSTGRGIDRNPQEAFRLWQAAASQGHVKAQYNLGLAYYLGEGVALNDRAAVGWFTEAAEAGLPEAQFILAQMLHIGVGVDADQTAALQWYQRAAAQGHAEAQKKVAELEAAGVGTTGPVASQGASQGASEESGASSPGDSAAVVIEEEETADVVSVVPPPELSNAAPSAEEDVEEVASVQVATLEQEAVVQVSAEDPLPPPLKPERPIDLSTYVPPPTPTSSSAPEGAPPKAAGEPITAAVVSLDPGTLVAKPGGGLLWFGTGEEQAEAQQMAERLAARFPEVFAQVPLRIELIVLGGKERWRVSAGPLDLDSGAALCSALRAVEPHLFCRVLPPA